MGRNYLVLLLIPVAPLGLSGQSPLDPLNKELPKWVRLGGELRYRPEFLGNQRFDEARDDGYLLSRVRLSVSLKPASWFSAFVEGQDAHVHFNQLVPNQPGFQDMMDLRQAFADVGQVGKTVVALRIGRQEINFGDQRLLGSANWGNVARSFDAARAVLHWSRVEVHGFAASVVAAREGAFDRHVAGDNLHGGWASIRTNANGGPVLEPFFFWHLAPRVAGERGGTGKLNLWTSGVRTVAKAGPKWDLKMELVRQGGKWGGDTVSSWAGFGSASRKLPGRWSPRWINEYNYASGDKNPADGRHNTFDILYPTPHDKYGLGDQIGWKNIHHIGSWIEVQPRKALILEGKFHTWWLASERDGIYAATGGLQVRDPSGRSGRHVGYELDLQGFYTFTKAIRLSGGVGYVIPGEFLKKASPGGSNTFAYMMLTYTL